MKADDPRLEKSRQEAIARVARVNEMMVTVLKSHIVVEQFMDEFLAVSGRKPKGTFADKAQSLACCRFRRHRVRCFNGTGGGSWRDGSLHGSSSLRPCG
jgi:hypothetical protein